MRVLDEEGRSGSLAYRGFCDSSGHISNSFHLDAPTRDAILPVEVLREILNRNQNLVVTEDTNGLLRIASNDVSRRFLDLKINVSFAGETDPNDAMSHAFSTVELGKFAGDHHFSFVPTLGGLRDPITADSPRIKGQLNGVTVAAALDHILQVFPGMWVYRECVTDGAETKASVWFARRLAHNSSKQH